MLNSVLARDSFTDADTTTLPSHTMNIGAGWVNNFGNNFTIVSNKARAANFWDSTTVTETKKSDVKVVMDVDVPNTASFQTAIALRVTDNDNCWKVMSQRDASGTPYLILYEMLAGSFTGRGSIDTPSAAGTTVTMTGEISGSVITGSFSTGESISYGSADTYRTNTKHGITGYGGSSGYATGDIDNLVIYGEGLVFDYSRFPKPFPLQTPIPT